MFYQLQVPRLDSIIIYRYPEFYGKDHAIVTSRLPEHLCFTAEVLESVQPLKRFQISHMTPRVCSENVKIPVLKASRAHRTSLRKLYIDSMIRLLGSISRSCWDLLPYRISPAYISNSPFLRNARPYSAAMLFS